MRIIWPRGIFLQLSKRYYVVTGYVVEDPPNYNYYVEQK